MPLCGECNNFRPQVGITETSGYCRVDVKNPHKVIRYHKKADDCPHYVELEDVHTDADQCSSMDPKLRRFKEYATKKTDVRVQPNEMMDGKNWG